MSLPDVFFAELDGRKVEAGIIVGFEAAARLAGQTDFTLYDGDPRRLFLSALAAMIIQQNVMIDLAGKGNLLRYAGNDTISDLGWIYGERGDRLEPSAAVTTVEFTLSSPLPSVVTIPANTRVVAGSLTFATIIPLNIPAGELTGAVMAQRDTVGADGNGMLPGQVFQIIDRPPFVESAVNTTESSGGADLEDLEAYRARLRLLPNSFSVAGPFRAYEFWAKTANAGIVDVAAYMPELDMDAFADFLMPWGIVDAEGFYQDLADYYRESGTGPGNVNVVPLMAGGQIPTQDILDQVDSNLDDKVPDTDFRHVIAPVAVGYDVEMTYWIDASQSADAVAIQVAVDSAVAQYVEWQWSSLGQAIIPDMLTMLVKQAGARRLEVITPVYTELKRNEVAQCSNVTVLYGGLERNY